MASFFEGIIFKESVDGNLTPYDKPHFDRLFAGISTARRLLRLAYLRSLHGHHATRLTKLSYLLLLSAIVSSWSSLRPRNVLHDKCRKLPGRHVVPKAEVASLVADGVILPIASFENDKWLPTWRSIPGVTFQKAATIFKDRLCVKGCGTKASTVFVNRSNQINERKAYTLCHGCALLQRPHGMAIYVVPRSYEQTQDELLGSGTRACLMGIKRTQGGEVDIRSLFISESIRLGRQISDLEIKKEHREDALSQFKECSRVLDELVSERRELSDRVAWCESVDAKRRLMRELNIANSRDGAVLCERLNTHERHLKELQERLGQIDQVKDKLLSKMDRLAKDLSKDGRGESDLKRWYASTVLLMEKDIMSFYKQIDGKEKRKAQLDTWLEGTRNTLQQPLNTVSLNPHSATSATEQQPALNLKPLINFTPLRTGEGQEEPSKADQGLNIFKHIAKQGDSSLARYIARFVGEAKKEGT
jgi:hypothetical protein